MWWIREDPVLYVLEKPGTSGIYETWLGVASLPRKYFLVAYLGFPIEKCRLDGSATARRRMAKIVRGQYLREGLVLSAMPTAQSRFNQCKLIDNNNLLTGISLAEPSVTGGLQITDVNSKISRSLRGMSDSEMNDLLDGLLHQHLFKVSWDSQVRLADLPETPSLLKSGPGPTPGPVFWA